MAKTDSLTATELRRIAHYDPFTGIFTHRVDSLGGRWKAGSPMGGVDKVHRYVRIQIHGNLYKAHRLAWLYMTGRWPDPEIDHRDGVRDNNRWLNLREASGNQNHQNVVAPRRDNTSGYVGVSYDPRNGNYRACIGVHGRQINLGRHQTAEAAHAARQEAKLLYHPFVCRQRLKAS